MSAVIPVEDTIVQLSDGRVLEAKPVRVVEGLFATDAAGKQVDVEPVYVAGGGGLGGLTLTGTTVTENSPAGTVIGNLSAGSGSWEYTLVDDAAGRVALSGTQLITTSIPFDYESGSTASVRIQANSDVPYKLIEQDFTLTIMNIVEVPVNTVLPVITSATPGVYKEGVLLTTTVGSFTNSPSAFSFQWYANGNPIVGALSQSYLPVAGDVGKNITVHLIASNGEASSDEVIAVAVGPVTAATLPLPVNTVAPTIAGNTLATGTLTLTSVGTWTNSPTSFAYQWRADGVDVVGEISDTYEKQPGDVGKQITCRVTATNAGGSGSAPSNAIGPLTAITPVITSETSFTTPENTTFNTVLTTDVPVTWSVVGGADAVLFSFTGATLTLGRKNFEVPVDADTNNTYVVNVRATHPTGGFAETTITVSVSNAVVAIGTHVVGANINVTAGTLTREWNHTIPDGSQRLLVVFSASPNDESASGGMTATFNGLPMTSGVQTIVNDAGSYITLKLFYMFDPPIGTYQVQVTRPGTLAGRWHCDSQNFTNIDKTVEPVTGSYQQSADASAFTTTTPFITTPDDDYYIVGVGGAVMVASTAPIGMVVTSPTTTQLGINIGNVSSNHVDLMFGYEKLTAGVQDFSFQTQNNGVAGTARRFVAAALAFKLAPFRASDPIFFVSPTGNDTNDGKSDATAWKSADKVDAFLSSGSGVPPDTQVLFKRGGRYTRTAFVVGTHENDYVIEAKSLATSGHMAKIGAYDVGADPIISGEVLYPTGWAVANDLNGMNPDYASIMVRNFAGTEGPLSLKSFPTYAGTMMYPAQWAKGVNPATMPLQRINLSDFNSPCFHFPPAGDQQMLNAGGTGDGSNPVYDPTKPVRYQLYAGTGATSDTANRYYLIIEYPEIAARYPNPNQLVGDYLVFREGGGNLTVEAIITAYDNTTGKITVDTNAQSAGTPQRWYFHESEFYWAIRYNPRDIAQVGQYGLSHDKRSLYGWFGAGAKGVARFGGGIAFVGNYWDADVNVECLSDVNTTSSSFVNVLCSNSNLRVRGKKGAIDAVIHATTSTDIAAKNNSIKILETEECPYVASAVRIFDFQENTIDYCRVGHSALSRTIKFSGGSSPSQDPGGGGHAKLNTFRNFIAPCHKSRHGNMNSVYQAAELETAEQFIATGGTTGTTSQNTPYGSSKGCKHRRQFITGSRSTAAPGAATWGPNTSGVRLDTREDNSIFDRKIVFWWGSAAFNMIGTGPNTGMIVQRMVLESISFNVLAAAGVTIRDCIIYNERFQGNAAWFAPGGGAGDPTFLRNRFVTAGEYAAGENGLDNGTITRAACEFLTRRYSTQDAGDFNPAFPTYEPVVMFQDTDNWTWTIPAWDVPYSLGELRMDNTPPSATIGGPAGTGKWNRNTPANESLGQLIGWMPGSTLSLPAGLTDNDLFFLERGVVCLRSTAPNGRLGGIGQAYSITVRETNAGAVNGPTRDTVLNFVTF